jgi:uncharacterized protein (DUF1684 family)
MKDKNLKALIFMLLLAGSLFGQDSAEILAFQDDMNNMLKDPETTPILEEDFQGFEGIHFFPVDMAYIVEARLVETEEHEKFRLTYSDDPNIPVYVKYGEIHFEVQGVSCTLNVYQNEEWIANGKQSDQLFLPFKDWTNGPESYGGGRFIDLHIPTEGDVITLDFNKSYNPPCAYNYYLACPLIPESNYIETEIRAGVLAFETF